MNGHYYKDKQHTMKIIRVLILLVCSSVIFWSCTTSKVVTQTIQDSTRVSIQVDTLVQLQKDTVEFNNLLNDFLLLEERIDSLNTLEPKTIIEKDNISKLIADKYKQKYKLTTKLYEGANKDSIYHIVEKIKINNKDTSYIVSLLFIIEKKGSSISLRMQDELNVLSSTTINTKTINRKVNFINWITSKFTLIFLVILGVVFIIIKIFR